MPEYIELNMANYDEDQVAQLNEWAISAKDTIERLEAFAESFLNPEENGRAVSAYIRDEARSALGMKRVEGPYSTRE